VSAIEIFVEVVGWGGALLILGGYLLLSMGKVDGRSVLYQGMNVVGAAGFIVNGAWHGAVPSAALNVVWMLIGAIALWRIAAGKKASAKARPVPEADA
jgi:hypothetical protein